MVIAGFSLQDIPGKVRFFEKIFLLGDTSMEVILGMAFRDFRNIEIQFRAKRLTWRFYIAVESLAIAR